MNLLPAIDLMGGEVVRLRRGEAAEKTVYSSDAVGFAKQWRALGADWLHIVDLDAAFSGVPTNLHIVRQICEAAAIPCELGGGMRSRDNIRMALDAGVQRVILGTRACEAPQELAALCSEFGGDRVAVGIDAKNGLVAVKGWTETTTTRASELALTAQNAGVGTIIYTDIATDGMLSGPNFPELQAMLDLLSCNLIASGGISSADDLRRLAALPRLHGAIIGKALYDGRITGHLRALLT